jgi:hypothetical protein
MLLHIICWIDGKHTTCGMVPVDRATSHDHQRLQGIFGA